MAVITHLPRACGRASFPSAGLALAGLLALSGCGLAVVAQEDAAALSLLAEILGGASSTSVLGRALQFDTQRSVFATAYYSGLSLDDTQFTLINMPSAGVTLAEAEADLDQVIAEFAGAQFGTFKPALADLAVAKLAPITNEMNRLMKDPAEIDRILGDGADRAEALARPIVDKVYDIIGMVRSRRG